jgi:photosystem I subunit 12
MVAVVTDHTTLMVTSLNQAEVLIALVVAAHAGVLAVRLCFSLYKA